MKRKKNLKASTKLHSREKRQNDESKFPDNPFNRKKREADFEPPKFDPKQKPEDVSDKFPEERKKRDIEDEDDSEVPEELLQVENEEEEQETEKEDENKGNKEKWGKKGKWAKIGKCNKDEEKNDDGNVSKGGPMDKFKDAFDKALERSKRQTLSSFADKAKEASSKFEKTDDKERKKRNLHYSIRDLIEEKYTLN